MSAVAIDTTKIGKQHRRDLFGGELPAPQRVRLDRTIDQRSTCCGNNVAIVHVGKGPHAAELRCADCGAHRGWLPKAIADFLMATISQFGWPEAVTVHNPEFAQANATAPLGARAAPQKSAP